MSITNDTRFESYQKVDKNRLQSLVIRTLKAHKNLTAREVAVILYDKGYLYSKERQAIAPRLTELVDEELVAVVGKRFDEISKKNVAVYALANDDKNKDKGIKADTFDWY